MCREHPVLTRYFSSSCNVAIGLFVDSLVSLFFLSLRILIRFCRTHCPWLMSWWWPFFSTCLSMIVFTVFHDRANVWNILLYRSPDLVFVFVRFSFFPLNSPCITCNFRWIKSMTEPYAVSD